MNRGLMAACVLSAGLHASGLTMLQQGSLLPMGGMQIMPPQSPLNFHFVEAPESQVKDAEPVRENDLISDKSTQAKDTFEGPTQAATETPHVGDPTGLKQTGRLMGRPDQQPSALLAPQQPTSRPEEQTPATPSITQDQEGKKKDYAAEIEELKVKIQEAKKQIQENKQVIEKVQKQTDSQTRGKVGLGGASLHNASSDVQGDVDRFGEIAYHAKRYELGEYLKKLKRKIEEFWLPYLAFTYSGGNLFDSKTVVLFKVQPDGTVADARVIEHRGDRLLKDFCLAAVQGPAPFEPLPEKYLEDTGFSYLPIVFSFSY